MYWLLVRFVRSLKSSCKEAHKLNFTQDKDIFSSQLYLNVDCISFLNFVLCYIYLMEIYTNYTSDITIVSGLGKNLHDYILYQQKMDYISYSRFPDLRLICHLPKSP